MPEVTEVSPILDDIDKFVSDHVVCSETKRTAIVLYAAATHAMREHVTMGRLLFVGKKESGKTLAMHVTAALSSAPVNVKGTSYAMQSALAAATNEPEKPVPTLYRDEIQSIFGPSGLNGDKDPVAGILREGYKRGATSSWSVNRTAQYFSIFTGFIMAGLSTAVPPDIRSRATVVPLEHGVPRRYFDAREAEPFAAVLQEMLKNEVARHAEDIRAFRALNLHPKMTARKLEVWEPLCAVAYALGGPRWLARAVAAFKDLALDASETAALSVSQIVTRDVAEVARARMLATGQEFAGGLVLAEELRHQGGALYDGRSEASLACLVAESVTLKSEQRTVNGERVRGYPVASLIQAWEDIRPPAPEDIEPAAEVNPFDCDDDAPEVPVLPVHTVPGAETGAEPAEGVPEDDRAPAPYRISGSRSARRAAHRKAVRAGMVSYGAQVIRPASLNGHA